jgi:hypothetical protein
MLSLTTLANTYFLGGVLILNQVGLRNAFRKGALNNTAPFKIITALVGGLALSVVCMAVLFRALELTGAAEMKVGKTYGIGVPVKLMVACLSKALEKE